MAALSRKLRSLSGGHVAFMCPACEQPHALRIDGANAWGYNGNPRAPTFTPSVLVRGIVPITDAERDLILAGQKFEPVPLVCHSFVTDGRIQFLTDCSHKLAGATVDLPDFDEE